MKEGILSINTSKPVIIENSVLSSSENNTIYIDGDADVTFNQCTVIGKGKSVYQARTEYGDPGSLIINGGFYISQEETDAVSAAIVSLGGKVIINNAYLHHPQYALLAFPLIYQSEIEMKQCTIAGRVVTVMKEDKNNGKYTDISEIALSPVSLTKTIEGTQYTFTNLANGTVTLPRLM